MKNLELIHLTNMEANNLAPKLRFRDIKNEYSKYAFSEIAEKRSKVYNPNKNLTNFKCIELESISKETGTLLNVFNSVDLKSNKTKFKEGDVLFGKLRPYLKKYLLTTFDGVCTSEIWVLNGIKVCNSYLFQLVQTPKFLFEANITSGSKMPRADWEYVSSIKYCIPSFSEQNKIASFLTSADKKINLLTKKKALLETYKKGVMQKIFSQEIRFKDEDGNNYPDWEEKKLGEVLNYEQPTKYIVKSTEYNNSYKTPVLTAGKSFVLGYTDESENIYFKTPVIIFDDFTMANKFVEFPFKVKSSAMKILKPVDENINMVFVYKIMQMIKYPKGNEHKRFWISEYSNIKISYPSDKEQNKIAEFLSNIDKKMELVDCQLERNKEFKKGLLQQMFV